MAGESATLKAFDILAYFLDSPFPNFLTQRLFSSNAISRMFNVIALLLIIIIIIIIL